VRSDISSAACCAAVAVIPTIIPTNIDIIIIILIDIILMILIIKERDVRVREESLSENPSRRIPLSSDPSRRQTPRRKKGVGKNTVGEMQTSFLGLRI